MLLLFCQPVVALGLSSFALLLMFVLRPFETLLLDYPFNNMSRMHLSDAEAGVHPLFQKKNTEEGLGLEIWTRGKGADWYLARVVELRQRIEGVLYLWPGEKSDTLLINLDAEDIYVAYLDTGAVEKITSEFHGLTTDDAVPMEIDWQSLFMSRLGGP